MAPSSATQYDATAPPRKAKTPSKNATGTLTEHRRNKKFVFRQRQRRVPSMFRRGGGRQSLRSTFGFVGEYKVGLAGACASGRCHPDTKDDMLKGAMPVVY
jgi:hypothetical protein